METTTSLVPTSSGAAPEPGMLNVGDLGRVKHTREDLEKNLGKHSAVFRGRLAISPALHRSALTPVPAGDTLDST